MLLVKSFWKIPVHLFAFCTVPHLSIPHTLSSKCLEEILSVIPCFFL